MSYQFTSPHGVTVTRRTEILDIADGPGLIEALIGRLDHEKGAVLSCSIEEPDRYSRFEFGFADPLLEFIGRGRRLEVRACNPRGRIALALLAPILASADHTRLAAQDGDGVTLIVDAPAGLPETEEMRTRQPSLFTPLRTLIGAFAGISGGELGLYGAFGYDLIFGFEPIPLRHDRSATPPDLHLMLPDAVLVVDRRKEVAYRHHFDFSGAAGSTDSLPRPLDPPPSPAAALPPPAGMVTSDITDTDYMAMVEVARRHMARGDIFEVVLSRRFTAPYHGAPSALFRALRGMNPSPYEAFIQFGDEQLLGTSPEMFVRVQGDRVETCPISGTIARTGDVMEDADRLKQLLNSEKDEVELTMCTDVDRNDKARICTAGTVKLLGRRLIERYAGLYHTVDHVEGRLRQPFDGLDAFIGHMWAVTLTGAPKKRATEIIEANEASARGWYGGALGLLGFDGSVNTGITIRTVHLRDQSAAWRVGATLVWDSDPAAEELETRTKATAFRRLLDAGRNAPSVVAADPAPVAIGRRVVLVDNEDSFVHTLADYLRREGAAVTTLRHGVDPARLLALAPDLVVHSPGPGYPEEFGVPALVRALAGAGLPQFGVCLGLQGMVQAFGGQLRQLDTPRHGKDWGIVHDGKELFAGLPNPCRFGAYHSLVADDSTFPEGELAVTARNGDGLVMAVRHRRHPAWAVQFHPESILSLGGSAGNRLVRNLFALLPTRQV